MKQFLFLLGLTSVLSVGITFATNEDTQIFDQLDNEAPSAEDLSFTTFQSCEEMNTVLKDYIKENFNNNQFQ